MSPSNFIDTVKFLFLALELLLEGVQTRQQFLLDFEDGSNMHYCGETIVTRLATVYVIVWVHKLLSQFAP